MRVGWHPLFAQLAAYELKATNLFAWIANHLKDVMPKTASAVFCTSASHEKLPFQSARGALLSAESCCSSVSFLPRSSCCWASRLSICPSICTQCACFISCSPLSCYLSGVVAWPTSQKPLWNRVIDTLMSEDFLELYAGQSEVMY